MARRRGGDKTLYSAPILLPYSPSFSWWKKTEMGGRKSSFRRKKRLLYHRAPCGSQGGGAAYNTQKMRQRNEREKER